MRSDPGALMGSGDPSPIDRLGAAPAVLAIHGYGGTPLEIGLVVEVATLLGLRAHAPLLPGHGTHARDLGKTGWQDWVRAAEFAFDQVSIPGSRTIVIGLSLGSLLAAHLAATRPDAVLALGMLASAVRLCSPFPAWPLRLFDRVGYRSFSVPKVGADIADPEARKDHLTYGLQPVNGAIEVLRAGERTLEVLPRIRCPAFIAHGRGDHVCPVSNADLVAGLLGSADKKVVVLPRSFHIVTRDYDRETLRTELTLFMERVRAS